MTVIEADAYARGLFGEEASATLYDTPSGLAFGVHVPGALRLGSRWSDVFSSRVPIASFVRKHADTVMLFAVFILIAVIGQ